MGFIISTILLGGMNRKSWAEFWFVEKVLETISRFCATLSAISCSLWVILWVSFKKKLTKSPAEEVTL